jgi:hypothetical protein
MNNGFSLRSFLVYYLSMFWRYLLMFVLTILAVYGCVPQTSDMTPVPPVNTSPLPPPVATPSQPDPTPLPPPVTDPTTKPSPSESIPRISVDELLQKIQSNADILIVDSRADVTLEFNYGHIKGAIPVPLSQITSGQWQPPADKNKEIIFYCT